MIRYNPIQKLAPQDCVASINGIVDKFDALVAANNTHAIRKFKSFFGLEDLTDNRDFAMTIAFPSKILSHTLLEYIATNTEQLEGQ